MSQPGTPPAAGDDPAGRPTPTEPTPAELAAMRRALALAATPGVPRGPNPRVGCVVLDHAGATIAEGYHQGAGSAHAEVAALDVAGPTARGATAVVTLEPCNHTGRTGPCVDALLAAGVRRVVLAQRDPNPVAAGGEARLVAAGVEVVAGVLAVEAAAINEAWTFAVQRGRPMVTWKVASTLDGRVAAADGSSRWVTGEEARAQVHQMRSEVDAVLVGTGTALADDPSLTVRDPHGTPAGRQPMRVVMGRREIPLSAALRDGLAPLRTFSTQSPSEVLSALLVDDVQHVLLEGGPTLAAAFLRDGLVDRVIWYLAPKILGAGAPAVADLGIVGIDSALQLEVTGIIRVGQDVRVDGRMVATHPA
ncbi:MAG TPA: bifunctional diaminohydroxyphosphoribosylaminopyrimidine deaminase/5-amino-6-(5-phosphoribosylamino)uracil reductase RibD [Motilibacterales bacterium]|nr:bifunctional diaminohydroxyphosphoribosylaminopyrimidine deaminase/5-amino-6-(5-phosphoribosylamino)uracil reductase RibD [Motilibacterales bacterium]